MAKLTSLNGKVTGKIGAVVYSTVSGQLIGREYNPNVANPNTVAQINQRAKMKLASQIAAALSPVIAYQRDGLRSPRNIFIRENMQYFIGNNGVAQVSYENLQLVKGNAALPSLIVSREANGSTTVKLEESASASISRLVIAIYKKSEDSTLQYLDSDIQETPGDDGLFETVFPYYDGELCVWAYGMRDQNGTATAKYGNYSVTSATDIAQLVMSRNLSASDYQFTRTRGTTLFTDESSTPETSDDQSNVYLTVSGPGSVSADKFEGLRGVVDNGTEIVLTATPNDGCVFLGWYNNGSSALLTNANPYTFTVSALVDLVAKFNDPNSSEGGSGSQED